MPIETFTRTARQAAIDVQNKFGDTGQVQITDDMLLGWINSAQAEIASNGFTLEGSATTSLIAGQGLYDLALIPTQIRSILQVRVNGDYAEILEYPEFSQFVRTNTATGATSSIATLFAGVLQLWPAPANSIPGGLIIDYSAYPADLTTLDAKLGVPDRFYQAVCDRVFAQALELDANFDAAQVKQGHFENQVTKQLASTHDSPSDYYHVVEPTAEWT